MNSSDSLIEIQRNRRVKLKRQRQIRQLQALWRSLLVSSMTAGLLWASSLGYWKLSKPDQIQIEENQYVKAQALREILVQHNSQSIITLTPEKIETILKKDTSVRSVTVSRQLFPPQITVAVEEQKPIALTVPHPRVPSLQQKGYLDERGVWMPQQNFQSEQVSAPFKIVGYRPQYRQQWRQLYPHLKQAPVEINTLYWQDPTNLILETELGMVHLGGNIQSFSQQLTVLGQLQDLPQQVPLHDIRYLNLKQPDFMLLELVPDATGDHQD